MWELRYSRDGFSVDAAIKKGRDLPEWYLDEPADFPGAGFFYDAYRDLTTCRGGDGPIPWTVARLYARDKGLAPDMAEALWTIVRKMDAAETGWRIEQLKAGGGDG